VSNPIHWILCESDKLTSVEVTRYIVGYKKEESDYLLKFLYDHIALSQDLQARIRWKAGTVVVWDVSALISLLVARFK
jgi:sulfonate dioxygenase